MADATLAALSRGARLRVLVQGARVTNDSATLAQIGLSQSGLSEGGGGLMSDPDYLSFMMEPSGGDTPGSTPGASPFHDPLDTDPAFLLSPGPVYVSPLFLRLCPCLCLCRSCPRVAAQLARCSGHYAVLLLREYTRGLEYRAA